MVERRAASSLPRTRLLFVVAMTIMLGGLSLMAWTLSDERQVTWERAVETSQNLGAALAHDIDRNIEIYDLSLRAVVDGLKLRDIWRVSPEMRRSALFDGAAGAQDLGAILVLDAAGNVVIDSRSRRPPPINFGGSGFFPHSSRERECGALYQRAVQGPADRQLDAGFQPAAQRRGWQLRRRRRRLDAAHLFRASVPILRSRQERLGRADAFRRHGGDAHAL